MKMKIMIFLALFLAGFGLYAQNGKYITKNGSIDFEASVAAFEPVKASNGNVTALLNSDNGELASLALMRGFRFKVALMEEHFNENYIESDTHPKATFKGKLQDFSVDALSGEPKEFLLEGELTIRGTTKKLKTTASISKKGEAIVLKSNFKVKPEDFDIEIPKVVSEKISKEILVAVDFELKKR